MNMAGRKRGMNNGETGRQKSQAEGGRYQAKAKTNRQAGSQKKQYGVRLLWYA